MSLFPSTSTAQVYLPLPPRYLKQGIDGTVDLGTGVLGASAAGPLSTPYVDLPYRYLLVVRDPAGNDIFNNVLSVTLPSGMTYTIDQFGANLTMGTSLFSTGGVYTVMLGMWQPPPDNVWSPQYVSFQWGGWIDTLLVNADESKSAAQVCQTVLTGEYDVDDPAAPTQLIISIDSVVRGTRTIANADGSAVNPAQVLRMGQLVPSP